MSVTEEDRKKGSSSTSKALGLAAAAVGVGVGAALYYLFSRGAEETEAPHQETDSGNSGWDRQKPLNKEGLDREITEQFRERRWSLEECSICCDVMLKGHTLEMLPCGHQFHARCVRPWLLEKTTCPNCRKTA